VTGQGRSSRGDNDLSSFAPSFQTCLIPHEDIRHIYLLPLAKFDSGLASGSPNLVDPCNLTPVWADENMHHIAVAKGGPVYPATYPTEDGPERYCAKNPTKKPGSGHGHNQEKNALQIRMLQDVDKKIPQQKACPAHGSPPRCDLEPVSKDVLNLPRCHILALTTPLSGWGRWHVCPNTLSVVPCFRLCGSMSGLIGWRVLRPCCTNDNAAARGFKGEGGGRAARFSWHGRLGHEWHGHLAREYQGRFAPADSWASSRPGSAAADGTHGRAAHATAGDNGTVAGKAESGSKWKWD
jgi:hypothetical protein